MSKSFALRATTTASTKRSPAADGGQIGAPETNVFSLACFPLMPVEAELLDRLPRLAQYQELKQTFVENGVDIKEGDLLVISNTSYPVRAVEEWYWRPDGADRLRIIVEELK